MVRKPVGWRKDPARHALAAKGIRSKQTTPTANVKPPYSDHSTEVYNEIEEHNLTIAEWIELRDLISSMEVVDCFGVRDVMRREQLEHKASEEELYEAWRDCGLSYEQFESSYN